MTTPGQFVFNSFGDESAAVPFEPINPLNQLGREGYSDTFGTAHT